MKLKETKFLNKQLLEVERLKNDVEQSLKTFKNVKDFRKLNKLLLYNRKVQDKFVKNAVGKLATRHVNIGNNPKIIHKTKTRQLTTQKITGT